LAKLPRSGSTQADWSIGVPTIRFGIREGAASRFGTFRGINDR
jgi:hypothetical protein